MDTSFGDREKRFILAEMIKASHVNLDAVISFVKGCNILPDWHEMQIPHGRNINQCKQVAVSMGIEMPPHAISQHQQQSYQQPGQQYPAQQPQQPQHQQQYLEQLSGHSPGQRQQQQPQTSQQSPHPQQQQRHLPLPPPLIATKRKPSSESIEHIPKRPSISSPEVHAASQPRNIQPRPPANGFSPSSSGPPVAAPAPFRVPKKRGRPSRADKVAQARAAGMTGHALPFLAPANRPIAANEPGPPISLTPPAMSPKSQNTSPKTGERSIGRPLSDQSPRLGRVTEPGLPKSQMSTEKANTGIPHPGGQERRSPKSPVSAGLPPSSRVAVSDLIKTTAPAVMTTGV